MPQVHQLPSSRLDVTAEIAYVRFHGQNPEQWAKTTTRNERCDYDYSDEALKEWVEPITNLGKYSETTYVLFNNHYRGKAAKNAETLQHMLKTPRPTVPTQAVPSCKRAPAWSAFMRLNPPYHRTHEHFEASCDHSPDDIDLCFCGLC